MKYALSYEQEDWTRDVIGHVTLRLDIGHYLPIGDLWNKACISSRFRDIGLKEHWGQDLDISGSRDIIGHVTI